MVWEISGIFELEEAIEASATLYYTHPNLPRILMMAAYPNNYAAQQAQRWLDATPVFLDTETTGLNDLAEIVEISILDDDGLVLLDTLVRPRRPIPADAIRIHGIRNEMVAEALLAADMA